jgi:hypothetical protein
MAATLSVPAVVLPVNVNATMRSVPSVGIVVETHADHAHVADVRSAASAVVTLPAPTLVAVHRIVPLPPPLTWYR